MRILVLGCGSIGERHIRCLSRIGGVELVACDPRPERLAAMRELYGVAETVEDCAEADLQKTDAVWVCTPTDQHTEQAMRAARAGCHLFVEKPICTVLEGVDELIDLCAKKGLVLQVGYVLRHHPLLQEVKAALEQGQIGRVFMAHVKVGSFIGKARPDYPQLYWAHAATGGGVLLNASHELDYILWLLGPVTQVMAQVDHYVLQVDPEVEDAAALVLRFASGALATVSFNDFQQNYKRGLELVGQEGTIEWSYDESVVRIYTESDRSWRTHSREYERDEFYLAQAESFLAAVAGRRPVSCTGEDGKRALELALAARRSAETGMVVRVGN